jgi:ABC-type phosphate transport system permease subunit
MGKLEYTLIALIIVIALSLALAVFLGEYFLFRYDHDEPFEESEE